uniref:Uncharacterized protein n=2 Tax=Anguilla anguilla TaxID=7936 RepID=A0A0E9VZB4_ANGAN
MKNIMIMYLAGFGAHASASPRANLERASVFLAVTPRD